MARGNTNSQTARVLDAEVFDALDSGIMRYAKTCRDSFFYPDKLISDVNECLNDAKYTLEAELSEARDRRMDAKFALEAAQDDWYYDEDGDYIEPDCSAEEYEYEAAVHAEQVVEGKIADLEELRDHFYQVEAEYKNRQDIFANYLDTEIEDASQWMKEEYSLMKEYISQGKQFYL